MTSASRMPILSEVLHAEQLTRSSQGRASPTFAAAFTASPMRRLESSIMSESDRGVRRTPSLNSLGNVASLSHASSLHELVIPPTLPSYTSPSLVSRSSTRAELLQVIAFGALRWSDALDCL